MKKTLLLLLTGALLAATASAAFATLTVVHADAATASSDATATASASDGMSMGGMGEGASRAWPSLADAQRTLERHGPILIRTMADFSAKNGVRGGNGTTDDPFVITGLYAPSLTIRNVSAAVTIRHVYVSGALDLDWTGPGALVTDSMIGEFLVNTNTPHTAPATWGAFTHDRIGDVVLRHAGGELGGDTIGVDMPLDADRLALNIEGYNGLLVDNDTIHGPTEVRLHGHHFADSFADAWMPMDSMNANATNRYTAIRIVDNAFLDPTGRGVDISDRAHAANDRTAKSEPDPALNDSHRHFTSIEFDRNLLQGAGLLIEDPNATDPHHLPGGFTDISLAGDSVVDPLGGVAVTIRGSHGANVTLVDSTLRASNDARGRVGVLLQDVAGGTIKIAHDTIDGFTVGVQATHVTKATTWIVSDDTFVGTQKDVSWDATVREKPQRAEG